MGTEIRGLCRQVHDRYRRSVRAIFVDETLLQIDGHDYWLWIAYEPAIDTCLMMHLSRERTIFVCYRFFLQLRQRYGRKPVFLLTVVCGTGWHAGGSDYAIICIWHRIEEHHGAIHTEYQGQDRVFR